MTLVPGVAVVTGASRGIGAACAAALAARGAPVVVNYRSSAELAESVAEAIRDSGGKAIAVRGDMTQPLDVARMREHAESELGPVRILVANAAEQNERKPFGDLSWDDFQRQLEVSLRQLLYLGQAFLPDMVARGCGRIIAIGSTQQDAPTLGSHAYATAKAALGGMTRALAKEVGEHGVTANVVVAGFTATDRVSRVAEEFRAAYVARTPLRRLGAPEDIAATVSWLASEEAGYVTGASFLVDGGHGLG